MKKNSKKFISAALASVIMSSVMVPFVHAEEGSSSKDTIHPIDCGMDLTTSWGYTMKNGGSFKFENDTRDFNGNCTDSDAYMNINILSSGTDYHDCLVEKIMNTTLKAGAWYKIEYSVISDNDGSLITRLLSSVDLFDDIWKENEGLLISDVDYFGLGQSGDCLIGSNERSFYSADPKISLMYPVTIKKDLTYTFTYYFNSTADISGLYWIFEFGGKDNGTGNVHFPEGTSLSLSNLNISEANDEELDEIRNFNSLKENNEEDIDVQIDPGKNDSAVEKQTKLMSGDLNGDGAVDLTDLTLLSLFILGDYTIDSSNLLYLADVDSNGIVDIADLARFKQYICHDDKVKSLKK